MDNIRIVNCFQRIKKAPLAVVFLHSLIFFSIYSILSFLGFIKGCPGSGSLMQWDAGWYAMIREQGYSYVENQQSNIAFFPLFPYLWKWLSVTPLIMSFVNLCLMYTGMVLLFKALNIQRSELLLLLATPSLFFCYVPYSEAVFFFGGALMIYGMQKKFYWALVGVFIACLSRSACLIFVPLFIAVLVFNYRIGRNNRRLIVRMSSLVAVAVVATLIVQIIQYIQTGQLFALFDVQKQWHRVMNIPELYLTTWDGARLLWLDGAAFLIGVCAAVFLLFLFVRKIKCLNKTFSEVYMFSLGYLALITITTILFSSPDAAGGTSIYSLNRFILASPFFAVFIIMLLRYFKPTVRTVLSYLFIAVVVFSMFNMFGYLNGLNHFTLPVLKTKLYFAIVILYGLSYLLMSHGEIKRRILSAVYLLGLILQIFLFNGFLNGLWIG